MRIHLLVAVACVMSVSLNAQLLNHPSRGVPRMPDGKPNLSAPAPRTADGKPDFSGIWQLEPNAPCPALGCQVDYPVGIEFRNLGAKLPGGAVRKLIQLPDLVVILSERDVTYRQIFLDGRSLPSDPIRLSTGIRPDAGTVTCCWCRRMDCAGGCGSIGTEARSAKRRR
jgi:hypothetical protein